MNAKDKVISENERYGGEPIKAGSASASSAEDIHTNASAPTSTWENTHRASAARSSFEMPAKMTGIPIFFRPKFYAILLVLLGALIGVVVYLLWR